MTTATDNIFRLQPAMEATIARFIRKGFSPAEAFATAERWWEENMGVAGNAQCYHRGCDCWDDPPPYDDDDDE